MEPGGGLAAPVAESMELAASPSEARDPGPWLRRAMALMVESDQGSPASRQRRARQALDQARSLGAPEPTLEALAQAAALQCLGQALAASGLQQAAICTRELAATTGCPSPSDNPLVDLQVLDRWVHPRSIRRYQEWILRGQGFQLQLDDGTYELVGCRADLDRNRLLLRRCQDGLVQELLSSECGEGYALTGQLLQAPGPHDGLSAPLGPAIVRAGNENFAHFLWNELDPILEMLGSGSPLEVVQDTDTVLALAALPGVRCLDSKVLSQRTSVRLGGTLVTERARRTVLSALRAEPLEPLPAERARPLILLGVRGPGRRELANEEQYYAALIAALRQAYPSGLILLDGFTYQGHGRGVGVIQQREQACTARIGRIIKACGGSQLENLSGLGFSAWLRRSEGIRFYVTHEGTMQHKVGWLRPQIPGLVLVGSADAAAIASWHRQQCEGAGVVATLPPALFAQEASPTAIPPEEQRNRPFRILDLDVAVELTMALIAATINSGMTADMNFTANAADVPSIGGCHG
uniref:hypothetical protein n=1 Tax=Cyanobium sp. TaxID=2164130 RepID=UPI004047B8A6